MVVLTIGALGATLHIADRYFQPGPYVSRLAREMSYAGVSAAIPRRLIAADLHPINGSEFELG